MGHAIEQIGALMGWPPEGVETSVTGAPTLVIMGGIDEGEHARRIDEGRLPVTDDLLLRCVCHEDPVFAARPSPVRIRAFVAVRRRWRSAFTAVGDFTAFAPRMIAVPAAQARSDRVAVEAIATGVGVVAAHPDAPWELLHAPAPACTPARTWVHRWVEESVYDALLGSLTSTRRAIP